MGSTCISTKISKPCKFIDLSTPIKSRAQDDNFHERISNPSSIDQAKLRFSVDINDVRGSQLRLLHSKSAKLADFDKILQKKVIIIGQSGHGKSTFINAMINYSFSKTPNDFYYIEDTEKNTKNFNSFEAHDNETLEAILNGEGVTRDCKIYKCKDNIEIIDTPGVSDKDGFDTDNKIIEKILEFAQKQNELAGIIYVINSTTCRKDPAITNSLNRLSAVIPSDYLNSVLVVYTFSPKRKKKFKTEWLPVKPDGEYYFDLDVFDFSQDEISEMENKVEKSWNRVKGELKEIFTKISILANKNVDQYRLLYKVHNKNKKAFAKLKANIRNLILIEKVVIKSLKFEQCSDEKMIKQINYIKKTYYSTICTICQKVCHKDCNIEFNQEIGNKHFLNCQSITEDGDCIKCGCIVDTHFHSYEIPKKTKRKVIYIITELLREKVNEEDTNTYKMILLKTQEIQNEINEKMTDSINYLRESAIIIKRVSPYFNMREVINIEIDSIKKQMKNSQSGINNTSYADKWKEILIDIRDELENI